LKFLKLRIKQKRGITRPPLIGQNNSFVWSKLVS
jgi:hypothetical protein